MCRRKLVKDMEKIQNYLDMLTAFTTQELLNWSEFCIRYESVLRTETDIFNNKVDPLESDKRWPQLLDLDIDKAEEYLSNLVVSKTVYAKIDRLEGVVHFTSKKMPKEVLNDWSYNTRNLMALINQTSHLINKERMIHGV
uniref:PCI domain-containing protein n=1 Tax=Trichobilharzia regenti TaxID=157069 RepID=A0AA85JEP2_TRIRE|nr:unnamed protein product [Trichobilharzia regenti]